MRGIAIRTMAFLIAAGCAPAPAGALVGEARDGADFAPYALMVLKRQRGGSSFCTGVVVAANAVLTAAHCAAKPGDLLIHYRDTAGKPALAPVAAAAAHPQYRANAARTRERSVDLALILLSAPLPERFRPARLDDGAKIRVGGRFRIAGFGVAREGAGATGGVLRAGVVSARAPLSSILLWAEDPAGKGFGACEGDSGGPIFAEDSDTLIAITDWAEGPNGRGCGKLTQGALIAPQRAWIDGVLRGWSAR